MPSHKLEIKMNIVRTDLTKPANTILPGVTGSDGVITLEGPGILVEIFRVRNVGYIVPGDDTGEEFGYALKGLFLLATGT